jgi:Lhr-like helicase
VWGLSATLGNLPDALAMLQGPQPPGDAPPVLVQGRIDKALVIDTLLPPNPGRFSWGGHLGAQMQQPVADEIARTVDAGGGTTLVFTNVRSQAERWYQALLEARPDWAGTIALHHGSLSGEVRGWVEAGLKAGTLKAVVCTSSLDLGVDFLPVEQVLQIGSAKGVARLVQRAGRSGHAPGRTSSITLVPTHSLELVEAAAARQALAEGRIEDRHTPRAPLDVLVQHLVTIALGGGFTARCAAGRGAPRPPRWQCWLAWACPWDRLATPPSPSTPSCAPPQPMLDAQRRLSQLPAAGTLLVEQYRSREGWHLFVYPFAGRHVHLGLASLLGWRLSRHRPNTFSISVNDYGFELLAAEEVDLSTVLDQSVFDPGPDLLADVLASLNSSELARRRFREIARVAGLVFTGYPGAPKSTRQLQASSGLFYDVFRQHDPGNRLLHQADAEVLAQELNLRQLAASLARLRAWQVAAVQLRAPSPFALALMVERFREQLSTEKLSDRLARIVADAEAAMQGDAPGTQAALPTGRPGRRPRKPRA